MLLMVLVEKRVRMLACADGSPAVAQPVLPGPAFGLASLRSAPGAGGQVETVERGDE